MNHDSASGGIDGLSPTLREICDHFDRHLHDQAVSKETPGSPAWYRDLADYRYTKLPFLPGFIDFDACADRDVLDVGCGVGIDLARFARAGARVTGIDLAPRPVQLAQLYLRQQGLDGRVQVMNGEELRFTDESFDVVYSHAALPYTERPERLVAEIHRVLRPGGTAILMGYHGRSWLNALSWLTRVPLEHQITPHFRYFTRAEVHRLTRDFARVTVVTERFPVPTPLHSGWKATAYNRVFVPAFNAIPRALTRRWGAHLMLRAVKAEKSAGAGRRFERQAVALDSQ